MPRILVVDDVAHLAEQYAYDLKRLGGYDVVTAGDGAECLEKLATEAIDCVILDLEMPGMDGFEVLRRLDAAGGGVPVIVYTGTGDYDRCMQAVRNGAYSFIDKAEPMQRVVQEVANALERNQLSTQVRLLQLRMALSSEMVGSSPAVQVLHERIARLAPIPSPVLIAGESGVGKELVARALHAGRDEKSVFLAINCAALPRDLVESELFGHERGAFTGAHQMRKGAFEAAGTGTLFLDEIGELPEAAQAKLLRVVEERQLTRVGGNRTIDVRCRVIAATNRDLDLEVRERRFREDLLYRLNVHVIRVPPLRERPGDIPELVRHFLRLVCADFGIPPKRISDAAMKVMCAYDWHRNNVRELRNVVERMVIQALDDVIQVEDVPAEIAVEAAPVERGKEKDSSLRARRAAAERKIVVDALEENSWHLTNTARELGLSDHSSLIKIMKRHGIRKPEG